MRIWIYLLLFSMIFSGCTYYAPPGENHSVRVVTAIDVTSTENGITENYHYTDTNKMQVILHYLRNLQPDKVTPIDPESFRTDAYEIRLALSDGTQTTYRQIFDEFLQKNDGRWHSIDRTLGAILPKVLDNMPSDRL